MLLCFCGVPIFDEICYKYNLTCSSLDLFFAIENNYIFTNFLLCFILVVTWNARDPGFVAESWTLEITWRKVSISDGTLKRESTGQEAEIHSSHPHIPGCCGGWGANCADTGASKSWHGFSAWEEKKKKPEVTEKVWIEKERRDFLLWIVINIECSATALALGKWHFVFFQIWQKQNLGLSGGY